MDHFCDRFAAKIVNNDCPSRVEWFHIRPKTTKKGLRRESTSNFALTLAGVPSLLPPGRGADHQHLRETDADE